MALSVNPISSYNQQVHGLLNTLYESTHDHCLFSEDCPGEVIRAHSISKAILRGLQNKGHFMTPSARQRYDESGRLEPHIGFMAKGLNQASTGRFVCRAHDAVFRAIDTTPMDYDDPKILNLLFYRSILMELWKLVRAHRISSWLEERRGLPGPPSIHPFARARALLEAKRRIEPFVGVSSLPKTKCPVLHLVRRVKTGSPIIAASCAGGSYALAFDRSTGQELPASAFRTLTGMEPNHSWGLTVLPEASEHVVVASWLDGSSAGRWFDHLRGVSGRELQAAVSAELILFCENWFLHPTVWASYSRTKKEAIAAAFDNFMELQLGKYDLHSENNVQWYDARGLGNRYQIDLFNYNESVLADTP